MPILILLKYFLVSIGLEHTGILASLEDRRKQLIRICFLLFSFETTNSFSFTIYRKYLH